MAMIESCVYQMEEKHARRKTIGTNIAKNTPHASTHFPVPTQPIPS